MKEIEVKKGGIVKKLIRYDSEDISKLKKEGKIERAFNRREFDDDGEVDDDLIISEKILVLNIPGKMKEYKKNIKGLDFFKAYWSLPTDEADGPPYAEQEAKIIGRLIPLAKQKLLPFKVLKKIKSILIK